MEIVHQLGKLFLGAVPTVIVVLLFYFFMRWAFFGPFMKAMAERNARIEGARAEAAAVEAEAKQELDSYNEALRKARAEIYGEQEAARQAALDNRAKLLKAMRSRTQEDVNAAKKRIAAELESARAEIERQTPELASQIARAILHNPTVDAGEAQRMIRAARNLARLAPRFVIAFILLAAPAFAQEEAKPKPEDSPTGQVFRWINFAIVVGILLYLWLRKALAVFPQARRRNLPENRRRRARARSRGKAAAPKRRPSSRISARTSREMRAGSQTRRELEAERVAALAKTEAEASSGPRRRKSPRRNAPRAWN